MTNGKLRCEDIPDRPILQFLSERNIWGTWFSTAFSNSVRHAMPPGTPDKLVLAKMRQLIRRGVVDGCDCGCRGDFEITDKGRRELRADWAQNPGQSGLQQPDTADKPLT